MANLIGGWGKQPKMPGVKLPSQAAHATLMSYLQKAGTDIPIQPKEADTQVKPFSQKFNRRKNNPFYTGGY